MFNCMILTIRTGASITECYHVLDICHDDLELAIEYLTVKQENEKLGIVLTEEDILTLAQERLN